jgi:peroxiredoxin Q/BCP
MVVAAMLMMTAAGGAQTPAPELKVGDQAPDFSLQASDGKTYKLSDFKGKQAVVLAWFPKAFTQGCTIECKSLAEHGDMIKKYNVKYFMASVDPIEGEQGNKAFAAAHNADFPLLSDPDKKTAEAYGVLNPKGMAGDRKACETANVCRRHGRQTRRAEGRARQAVTALKHA